MIRFILQLCAIYLLCVFLSYAFAVRAFAGSQIRDLPFTIYQGNPEQRSDREWRSTVLLQSELGICTGTLVSSNTILTAAHCAEFNLKNVVFYTKVDQIFSQLPIESVTVHPLYNKEINTSFNYDLALVKFRGKIPSNNFYPALLFEGRIQQGAAVRVAGFGMTQKDDPRGVTKGLYSADMKLQTILSQNYHVVSLSGDAGICPGDSGSPVFVQEDGAEYLAAVMVRSSRGDCSMATLGNAIVAQDFSSWIETVK